MIRVERPLEYFSSWPPYRRSLVIRHLRHLYRWDALTCPRSHAAGCLFVGSLLAEST